MTYNTDFNCIRYIILLEAKFSCVKKVYAYSPSGYNIHIYIKFKKKKYRERNLKVLQDYCNRDDVRPITSIVTIFPIENKPKGLVQNIDFTKNLDRARIGNFPSHPNVEKFLVRNIEELDIVRSVGPIGKARDQQVEYKCYSEVTDNQSVENKIRKEFSKLLTPEQYGSLILVNNPNLGVRKIEDNWPHFALYPYSEKVDEYVSDPSLKQLARNDYDLFVDNMHDVSIGKKKASDIISKNYDKKSTLYLSPYQSIDQDLSLYFPFYSHIIYPLYGNAKSSYSEIENSLCKKFSCTKRTLYKLIEDKKIGITLVDPINSYNEGFLRRIIDTKGNVFLPRETDLLSLFDISQKNRQWKKIRKNRRKLQKLFSNLDRVIASTTSEHKKVYYSALISYIEEQLFHSLSIEYSYLQNGNLAAVNASPIGFLSHYWDILNRGRKKPDNPILNSQIIFANTLNIASALTSTLVTPPLGNLNNQIANKLYYKGIRKDFNQFSAEDAKILLEKTNLARIKGLSLEEYLQIFDRIDIKSMRKIFKKLTHDDRSFDSKIDKYNKEIQKLGQKDLRTIIFSGFSVETLAFDLLSTITALPLSTISMSLKVIFKALLHLAPNSEIKENIMDKLIELDLYKKSISTGISFDSIKLHKIYNSYVNKIGEREIHRQED